MSMDNLEDNYYYEEAIEAAKARNARPKTKMFPDCHGGANIDKEINEFLTENNANLIDIKVCKDYLLLIYRT